jgi:phosphodiesterase/alkaline phosphatase D-like protein
MRQNFRDGVATGDINFEGLALWEGLVNMKKDV